MIQEFNINSINLAAGGERISKRSWPAITIDILDTAMHPVNKMRIMCRANLNFERFNKYFYDLLSKGFIEEVDGPSGRTLYVTTERGRALYAILGEAQKLVAARDCSKKLARVNQ